MHYYTLLLWTFAVRIFSILVSHGEVFLYKRGLQSEYWPVTTPWQKLLSQHDSMLAHISFIELNITQPATLHFRFGHINNEQSRGSKYTGSEEHTNHPATSGKLVCFVTILPHTYYLLFFGGLSSTGRAHDADSTRHMRPCA